MDAREYWTPAERNACADRNGTLYPPCYPKRLPCDGCKSDAKSKPR
jgi:hypothetical protein